MKVLIVDPDRASGESLADIVRQCGQEAKTAADEADTLTTVRAWRPDFVFMEVGRSELDGYALAKQLREEAGFGQGVLVVVSEYSEDQAREDAAGIDRYIQRPVTLPDVQAILRS